MTTEQPTTAAGRFHRDHERDMADPEYASAFREASAEVTPTAAGRPPADVADVLRWLAGVPLPRMSDGITTRLPLWVLHAARAHCAEDSPPPPANQRGRTTCFCGRLV